MGYAPDGQLSGPLVMSIKDKNQKSCPCAPDGHIIWTIGYAPDGQIIRTIGYAPDGQIIRTIGYAPDGQIICVDWSVSFSAFV